MGLCCLVARLVKSIYDSVNLFYSLSLVCETFPVDSRGLISIPQIFSLLHFQMIFFMKMIMEGNSNFSFLLKSGIFWVGKKKKKNKTGRVKEKMAKKNRTTAGVGRVEVKLDK